MNRTISTRPPGGRYSSGALCAATIGLVLAACSPVPAEPRVLNREGHSTINFDDTALDGPQGSVAQLAGFDNVSLLTFATSKGVTTAALDGGTVFRIANLNHFAPTDPCRAFAINYNAAASSGDVQGLNSAIWAFSNSSCYARIHVDKVVPPNPTAPIKSFRPHPGL